jgi:alpha-tubulin suppressor-like RCC1 family protein
MGDGRLGHGKGDASQPVFLPKRIEALHGVHVTSVAAGESHALALTSRGRVYPWGANGHESIVHSLGKNSDSSNGNADYFVPMLVPPALLGECVRAIAAGVDVSCAVTKSGALYTWGDNTYGSLGHGDVRDRRSLTLVRGLRGVRVLGVSIHDAHTLAVTADGSVYAFGEGPGLGLSQDEALSPTRIPGLVGMVPRPRK